MNPIHNILYTVGDLDAAKVVHTALLGGEPHTDQPYYVGYHVAGVEIALTSGDPTGRTAPVAHVLVDDIDAALAAVQHAGARLASEPKDVGGGAVVATVTDPSGNTLGLIQRPPA